MNSGRFRGDDPHRRFQNLALRYATPLPQLVDEVATLASRVDEHLKKMGFHP